MARLTLTDSERLELLAAAVLDIDVTNVVELDALEELARAALKRKDAKPVADQAFARALFTAAQASPSTAGRDVAARILGGPAGALAVEEGPADA